MEADGENDDGQYNDDGQIRSIVSQAVMMLAVRMSEDDDLSDGEGERNM